MGEREMGKEELHGSSLVQAMDTNKQDLPISHPSCHRQSHSRGCSQSWVKEPPFPGLTLLPLHQPWGSMGSNVKSTREKHQA